MKNIEINVRDILTNMNERSLSELKNRVEKSNKSLEDKTGEGNNFLGWLNINSFMPSDLISEIQKAAATFSDNNEIVVVIGIGGSYLGAKAVIEALSHNFTLAKDSSRSEIIFAGFNICEDYLYELLEYLNNKNYSLVVISKSGTTTEPAIAFRILKEDLEKKYGKNNISDKIIAVTDKEKGALREMAINETYNSFIIPENIGGRYSVLSPVGLLPVAIAGFDIEKIIQGATLMENLTSADKTFENNPAAIYAAARKVLYNGGKTTEILVNYNSRFHYFAEWWKQLFGESEGKDNSGIFPVSVDFTADLHSLGQYIQEGKRNLFETVISIEQSKNELLIPHDDKNSDNLNYISGKRISYVNHMAEKGTRMAHLEGGVPNISINLPKLNEFYLGQLIYFFERACAISGYTMGINPFDQPGVEKYKNNMFKLLGKPGFIH